MRPNAGLTTKAALSLGFSLTLGLWLFTGYQIASNMAEVDRQSSGVTARHIQAQDLLASLRTHTLATSGLTRDLLLDPLAAQPNDREQIEEELSLVQRAVTSYAPVRGSQDEQDQLARLRTETDQFESAVLASLASDGADPRRQLSAVLFPRRNALVAASEEMQLYNRAAFVQYQTELAASHAARERQTWQRLGLVLAVSLGIAILATLYASRLERRLVSQLEKDARNTRALQQLSTSLITAQEEERGRIARELHDEVGQALTAIKVELAVAQRKIHGGASELLEPAQAITDRTLNTVRDLSHLLHPAMLDDLGMAAAVESYVRGFSKRHGLRVDLRQDDLAARLAPEIEVAAYRIVQEALTNVVKHAGASACRVAVGRYQSKLQIVVADDGRGFDLRELEDAARHGLGLIGMRERVSQLNGSFFMESAPGRGTTLRVEFPLDSAGQRHDDDAQVAGDALQPESARG